MTNIENIQEYSHNLLHEIQFWQINVHLIEQACEKEEKRIISLWNDVINEIDRRQLLRDDNGTESKS